MKDTQMPPVHAINLVANSGNTAHKVFSWAWPHIDQAWGIQYWAYPPNLSSIWSVVCLQMYENLKNVIDGWKNEQRDEDTDGQGHSPILLVCTMCTMIVLHEQMLIWCKALSNQFTITC